MNSENTNNSDCINTASMLGSTDAWDTSETRDEMARKNYPAIISNVNSYFGGNVTPLVMRRGDERISAPLKKLPSDLKFDLVFDTIAIPCGSPSGGLCAIVMPKESESLLKQLLELNPQLANALLTHWRAYLIVWLRILDWHPTSQISVGLMWVADGYVPMLDVLPYMKDKTLPATSGQSIPSLNFEDLKWPPGVAKSFIFQRIFAKHGRMLWKSESGRVEINHKSIAHYLRARDVYVYNHHAGGFSRWLSDESIFKEVSETRMKQVVTDLFHELSIFSRPEFPVSKIKAGDVKVIIDLMRLYCAEDSEDEQISLARFVSNMVEPRKGADVTIDEMHGEYVSYCQGHDLQACPRSMFFKELPSMIRRRFGVIKSHCVKRPTADGVKYTARNGFFRLAMKQVVDNKDG